jgi:hypothetical protein
MPPPDIARADIAARGVENQSLAVFPDTLML